MRDLSLRQRAAWSELAAASAEPNPYMEPQCILPAARHLGNGEIGVLAVVGPGKEWLACLPVTPHLRRWHADLPALAAWRHLYSCLGTPLIAASDVTLASEHLLEQALQASRYGIVALPWMSEDGPVIEGILAAAERGGDGTAVHHSFERAFMRRQTIADGVSGLLSARHRRDLRRLARRLAETLDGPVAIHDETDDPSAVERFLELEASGWKGAKGTALASRRSHADYFRELCDGFRSQGRLQLLSFGTDRRAVSYKCNLLAGDGVFCFKIAHDEAFAHFRPGLQLEVAMLEWFRTEMPHTWIDSCAAPDSKLFEHLWPERRRLGNYIVTSSRALGWTIDHSLAGSSRR